MQINISIETHHRLDDLKGTDESFDDVINRLLLCHKNYGEIINEHIQNQIEFLMK